jgi:hypothetical protein
MLSASRKLQTTLSSLEIARSTVEACPVRRLMPNRHWQKAGAEMKCGGIKDASLPRLQAHPLSR